MLGGCDVTNRRQVHDKLEMITRLHASAQAVKSRNPVNGVQLGWGGWRGRRCVRRGQPGVNAGPKTASGGKGPRGALQPVAPVGPDPLRGEHTQRVVGMFPQEGVY